MIASRFSLSWLLFARLIALFSMLSHVIVMPTMLNAAARKPSSHSSSLIQTYVPKKGGEERTQILNAGANWDVPDLHYRPYMKVLALRAAKLRDLKIAETGDWKIAFLQYQYDQFQGIPTGVGYVIVKRNEAGEWTKLWSFDDGGGARDCSEMFDHMMKAKKLILKRGLDPRIFASELSPLHDDIERAMREDNGICVGDFDD